MALKINAEKLIKIMEDDLLADIKPSDTPFISSTFNVPLGTSGTRKPLKATDIPFTLTLLERVENLEKAVEKLIRWGPGE